MNKCYLIGKVISEPLYDFFFMQNDISICYFTIGLAENTTIDVFGINEMADYIYQNININELIMVEGTLNSFKGSKITVEISNIEILEK